MSQEWFYTKDNKSRLGPVSSQELETLAKSGRLLPTDKVCKQGMTQWVVASTVKGLFSNLESNSKMAASRTATTESPKAEELEDDDRPRKQPSNRLSGRMKVGLIAGGSLFLLGCVLALVLMLIGPSDEKQLAEINREIETKEKELAKLRERVKALETKIAGQKTSPGNEGTGGPEKKPEKKPGTKAKDSPEPKSFVGHAKQLANAFFGDRFTPENNYGGRLYSGKVLQVRGRFGHSEQGDPWLADTILVTLQGGDGFGQVWCFFDATHKNEIEKFPGGRIVVQGLCKGSMSTNIGQVVQLTNCEILKNEILKVSASDFCKEYRRNQAAASEKYQDMVVELTGTVKKIWDYNNTLGFKEYGLDITCKFAEPEIITREKITEGQTVTVRGDCEGGGYLSKCELVK